MHIVVHAGPPKTGSSTLQLALRANREALAARGIAHILPADPPEWSLIALYGWPGMHQTPVLTERFPDAEAQRRWSAHAWTEFEAALDKTEASVVVISSEHFDAVRDKADLVARLRQRADRVTFVAYARDPVALYTSDTDQAIRVGHVFSRLKKPGDYPYSMRAIRSYAEFLPADDLVVRSFDPAVLVGGDLVADFFSLLAAFAGRPVPVESPVPRQNESLCGAATLWLLSTNALGPFRGEARKRRVALFQALRVDPDLQDLPKLKMTNPEIATTIQLNNRDTLDWLNAGPLAQAPLETAPADARSLPEAQLRERLRRWLLSYGRADHMRRVMQAVMRHGAQKSG